MKEIRRHTLILISFTVISCSQSKQEYYPALETHISNRNYQPAIALFESKKPEYVGNNQVLYNVEVGMLYHLAGNYDLSNQHLIRAEREMEDLYTLSLADEAGSYFTNDLNTKFEGEDFEKIMVNTIAALNYALSGDYEGALVETRKIDNKLNVLNDRYQSKNLYKEDAFARYLSGILYEAIEKDNDAFISYVKAFKIYQNYKKDYGLFVPNQLKLDLLRLSKGLGFDEEYQNYSQNFSKLDKKLQTISHSGELIFFSFNGLIPIKVENRIRVPVPSGTGITYHMQIAFPKFKTRMDSAGYANVRLIPRTKDKPIDSEMTKINDIRGIAIKNLQDHVGRIRAKAIGRATIKFLATKVVQEKVRRDHGLLGGILTGIAGNVIANVTEKIDDRSWRLLPASMHMSRIFAPSGVYDIEITYFSHSGTRIGLRYFKNIEIKQNEKRFLINRFLKGN